MVAQLSTYDPDTDFGDVATEAPARPGREPEPQPDGAGRLLQIPLAWLVPDAGNERGPLDPADPELRALADSIKRHGVREPLHVYPAPARTGGRTRQQYFIQSGHRRYAAAALCELATVPCIVEAVPADARSAAQERLLGNAHRQDLNPVEWARGFQALASYGMTQEQIAAEYGISQGEVSNHLRLLSLEPEILGLVEAGKLSKSHARELLRIPDDFVECDHYNGPTGRTLAQIRTEWASEVVQFGWGVASFATTITNRLSNNERANNGGWWKHKLGLQQQANAHAATGAALGMGGKDDPAAIALAEQQAENARQLAELRRQTLAENNRRAGERSKIAKQVIAETLMWGPEYAQQLRLVKLIGHAVADYHNSRDREAVKGLKKGLDKATDINGALALIVGALTPAITPEHGGLEISAFPAYGRWASGAFNLPMKIRQAVKAADLEDLPMPSSLPTLVVAAPVIEEIAGGDEEPRCRVCGCTDEEGCEPDEDEVSCWWVEPDLCSRCVGTLVARATKDYTPELGEWMRVHVGEYAAPDTLAFAAVQAVFGAGVEIADEEFGELMGRADVILSEATSAAEGPKF